MIEEELDDVRIEISVISVPERVHDFELIEIGKHGLIVESAGRRGLLLPQVASEYGWDREVFLQNTSLKAGLPADAWKHPATAVYTFYAEIFGEDVNSTLQVIR